MTKLSLYSKITILRKELTIKDAIERDYKQLEEWLVYNFKKLDIDATIYLCQVRNSHLRKQVRRPKLSFGSMLDEVVKVADHALSFKLQLCQH